MTTARFPTLRLRFALRAAALVVVFTWLVGFVSAWYFPQQLRDAVEDGVADHLAAVDAELDLVGLPAERAHPLVLPAPEQFVQVLDQAGTMVVVSSELVRQAPLIPEPLERVAAAGDESFTVTDPERPGSEAFIMARRVTVGDGDYLAIVGAPLDRVDAARRSILWITGLGGPLIGLFVGALVWASVTLALRPVNALAAEADRLGRGRGPWKLAVEPDTAELRGLARSFDDLLAQIRDAFARERAFLDDASHELRTPIAVARGELDLGLSGAGRSELIESVRSAIEELDRLDRLASDLLVLARTRGADPASLTEVDVVGVTRRVAATIARRPTQGTGRIVIDGEGRVVGDEHALERAIANIVLNAVEHRRDLVRIEVTEEDAGVLITVEDDGAGFPPALLESALERFTRARDGGHDGTGLGLAISSEIAAAHGGELTVANGDEGGAVVRLWLPSAGVAGTDRPGRVRAGGVRRR